MKQQYLKYITIVILSIILLSCNYNTNDNKQDAVKDSSKTEIKDDSVKRLFPKFNVTEYCDKEDQDSVYFYLEKLNKKTAFNISVKKLNDTLKINYKLIDNCCLKYRGEANIENNKLNISNLIKNEEVCECFCIYEFEFIIPRIQVTPEFIYINEIEIKK